MCVSEAGLAELCMLGGVMSAASSVATQHSVPQSACTTLIAQIVTCKLILAIAAEAIRHAAPKRIDQSFFEGCCRVQA